MRQMATSTAWVYYSCCTNRMFRILQEVGVETMFEACVPYTSPINNTLKEIHQTIINYLTNTNWIANQSQIPPLT